MIQRFVKIHNNLYRGGRPTKKDVIDLHNNYKIKKIISLDKTTGDSIKDICKELNIEHIIIPIDINNKFSFFNVLGKNIKKLLDPKVPTFFHCFAGKDRTGFLGMLYRILVNKWPFEEALEEAESLDFGTFVSDQIIDYIKHILNVLSKKQSNNLNHQSISNLNDIRDNARETLSTGGVEDIGGYAPIQDQDTNIVDKYPGAMSYTSTINGNESETRESYRDNRYLSEKILNKVNKYENQIPSVGLYSGNQLMGAGPVEVGGGSVSF